MQAKDYERILDSLQMTGIYVIREDNHQILYFNRRVKEVAPNIRTGMVCHELWAGSCANCPLLTIGNRQESRSVNYDDPFGKAVDIVATRILWEDTIPAFSVAVTPHPDAVNTYNRILRVNLTTDSFEIVQIEEEDRDYSDPEYISLSQWFDQCLRDGKVYRNDEERFRRFTELEHLKEELRSGKKIVDCTYRYRAGKGYRWHTMEVIPDFNYSEKNQRVMLYVKDVHDIYKRGVELEEITIQNQEVIKSLGEMNFGVFVIDLWSGTVNPIRLSEDMSAMNSSGIPEWNDWFKRLLEEYFLPDYRGELWKAFSLDALREAWTGDEKRKEVLCQCRLHGDCRYVSATMHYYGNGAETHYAVLALQDVDQRTRQEIQRGINDRRMAAIIRSRFQVMSSVDLDTGRCERFLLDEGSDFGAARSGDYETFTKLAADQALYEDDIELFLNQLSLENLRKKAAEVENYEEMVCEFRFKGPEIRWKEEHLFFIRQDAAMLVNILERDVTNEKQREATFMRERKERNDIISSMSRLFFACYYMDLEADTYRMVNQIDEVGTVLRAETKCTRAFQTYAKRFVHPDDREEYLKTMNCENMRNTLSWQHPYWAIEYRRIAQENGKTVNNGWIRATVVLSEMKDGKPNKVLYVAQEITDIKEKEEREHRSLKEAYDAAIHANAAKSEFLSRMSHDIRTPMNAIIGMTAIAGTHLDDRDRVSDCLNKITTSSKHLLSLINEVLDMSKIESGKIDLAEEEFNLSDLIQNLLTMIRPSVQEKGHEMALHVAKIEHEDVAGDVMRLQQVFMNILGNAVKYTPAGGKLELEISEKPSKVYGYGCYEFIFKDNGIGMTEEFVNRIFEPFSRAEDSRLSKIEGTGLGMTIALNIVQMMNGSIHIDSKIGEGSTFTVTLFLKQRNTDAVDMEQFCNLPVLVVDDDRFDCESACRILDELGMKSEGVLSGREAVARVREAKEEENDYFAVILDWKMPDMDGVQTAREIRRFAGPDVTIIILSAYDWSDVETEARQAGVDGFLSKPMFKSRLIYLLKKLGKDEEEKTGQSEDSADYDFHGKRILVVEDNELNREIAEEVIKSTGADVECAQDGKQAVEMVSASEAGYYDLIFMDIRMPVMNGYEASKAIRRLARSDARRIPIIAMTADAFSEDVAASRKAGMNEHISKPINIGQMMDCIKRWTDQ